GVRIATGDKRLDVVLDEKKGEITLTVKARGGTRELSSVTLSSSGITLDAGATGDVKIKGRSVTVNGKTGVTVDGGLLAVLKAKLIRIN
ncbi:type IV secretion protein Rhs, partial [Streptomyces sp. SID7982]|nr:type IV secretion protein Rhs [Streptomyces sp. SID7982]